MSPTCASCGYVNPLGARFCSSCGVELSRSVSDSTTAIHDLGAIDPDDLPGDVSLEDIPAGVPGVFVVRQGPMRGSRIHLDAPEINIGRHPDSDIFLDDVTVSRRHAVLHRVEGGFEVSDAGSLNGTYVNQNRVERERLSDGDEVQVGKFKLVYVDLANRR
ncbi:MAG: FHA domain-containing protein [Acidimicrobiales bacterium]